MRHVQSISCSGRTLGDHRSLICSDAFFFVLAFTPESGMALLFVHPEATLQLVENSSPFDSAAIGPLFSGGESSDHPLNGSSGHFTSRHLKGLWLADTLDLRFVHKTL